MLTNELEDGDHPGHRDGFARLAEDGGIEAFTWAAPKILAKSKGHDGALREILAIIRAKRSNVVVQISTQGFPYEADWFRAVAEMPDQPILLYWEGDAWSRFRKPVPSETRLWWKAADIVFTVAFGQQQRLIESLGGRDVRFAPFTYDHVHYRREEANEPPTRGDNSEVVVIGNWWGNRRFVSRLPGARQRYGLVRGLQRDESIPLAVYGRNWTGRGVKGSIPHREQARVARRALMTANWDHFPHYAAFYSDRLAIQLLAGRAHVTTLHPQSDWLPGQETGLFLEPSVGAAIHRVRDLLERPQEEVLELGRAAHQWVRHRLSHRELARYMVGTVDERLLPLLPDDPWSRLPS